MIYCGRGTKAGARIALAALIFCAIVICVTGFTTGDEHANGFLCLWGSIQLGGDRIYVQLTDEPIQLMTRKSDAGGAFQRSYFDVWHPSERTDAEANERSYHEVWKSYDAPTAGVGVKDGRTYECTFRTSGNAFCIVTLKEVD